MQVMSPDLSFGFVHLVQRIEHCLKREAQILLRNCQPCSGESQVGVDKYAFSATRTPRINFVQIRVNNQ